jgi:hypothetical protein
VLINNRLIWSDNGVMKDLSIVVNNLFSAGTVVPFAAAQDKLFVGSDLPFNHRFFELQVANDVASVASVDVWDGFNWVAAVDVLDQTKDTGGTKTMSQNGIISWQTDRSHTWGKHASTELMLSSGLQTLKIYEMYWVRFSFSVDLKATFAIKYMGHKFSNDSDLGGYYPDLNRSNVMIAFQAGKTDWSDQHVLAAEEIIRDLRKKNVIWNPNQIFVWDEFADASIHKVAEIVYTAFGKDYESRRESARENYDDALDKVVDVAIDKNEDGKLSEYEKRPNYGRLIRG